MTKHSRKQQTIFIAWLNKLLDDDFLSMEVRSRLQGEDVSTKKLIKDLQPPSILKQEGYEILWYYIKAQQLRSDNLINAVKSVQIIIESFGDIAYLKEKLNTQLRILGIPQL